MHPVYTIRHARTQGRMSMLPGPSETDRIMVISFQNKQHAMQVKPYSFLCTLMKRKHAAMLILPKKIDPRLVDKALLRPIPIQQLTVDTCDVAELQSYYALHSMDLARVTHVVERPDCFYLKIHASQPEPFEDKEHLASDRVHNHLFESYTKPYY